MHGVVVETHALTTSPLALTLRRIRDRNHMIPTGEDPMRRNLGITAAALAAAAALVAVPLTSASSVATKLQIGFSLHFTGPSSAAGTFIASGAIQDSGTATVPEVTVDQLGNQDDGRLTGTEIYTSALGTITTTFSGIAGPATSPHQAGKGTFKIVSGTGAYAGVNGQGTFLVVVDLSTNQIIGTEDGQAN
jgi:hypothetical protein